jgi:hypothetical protein
MVMSTDGSAATQGNEALPYPEVVDLTYVMGLAVAAADATGSRKHDVRRANSRVSKAGLHMVDFAHWPHDRGGLGA